MDLSEWATLFQRVHWSDDTQFTALCPAHPDKTPSLSASVGSDDRVLLKCFAGCSVEQICGAVGKKVADLFAPKPQTTAASPARRLATLSDLATAKKIQIEWLRDHGCDDAPDGSYVGIGYFDQDENQVAVRKRWALKAKDGSAWPKGSKLVPYGLWMLKEWPGAPDLTIVEGETDCWALWFNRVPALGLPGATNVKCLESQHLADRARIFVVQEPDSAGSAFPGRVAQRAREIGWKGQILAVTMPSGIKDPADLHVAGRFAEWPALLAAARPLDQKQVEKPIIDAKAPHLIAKAYVKAKAETPEGRTLHHWDDIFWTWTGTHYIERTNQDQRAALGQFITDEITLTQGNRIIAPNTWHTVNTLDMLKSTINLPMTEVTPPTWIGEQPDETIRIAVENGIVAVSSGQLTPPSPRWFCFNSIRTSYDADAECPEWLKFLSVVWSDQQSRDTLQEIFGYLLTADMKQQKLFGIVGPPRSGKGTIGRVIEALLGRDTIGRPAMADFGYQFGLEPLIGKSLAIMSDVRLDNSVSAAMLSERLLAISGEDGITVTRKHQSAWGGQLRIHFLLLTNELPKFKDPSGALPSRFILLKTQRSFLGKEDYDLYPRLARELPGILNWAIEGWMRLEERGHFIQPEESIEMAEHMTSIANPIAEFISDECIKSGSIHKVDLYKRYLKWCEDLKNHALAMPVFFRDLRAYLPDLKFGRQMGKPRHIEGLRLKTEQEKTLEMADDARNEGT
jgi:putative DNA primase/helicase